MKRTHFSSVGAQEVDDFSTPVLTIIVDKSEREFHVHAGTIHKQSKFFQVEKDHGSQDEVRDVAAKRRRVGENAVGQDESVIKTEKEGSETEAGDENEAHAENKKMANFYLPHVKADAFATFTRFLYNKYPPKPKNLADCKVLIRSYLLALQYEVFPLQNRIVDRMREFHNSVDFNIDIFAYLMNRQPTTNRQGKGEPRPNNLMKYFISQMAFDVATKGWEEFVSHNEFFHYFISDNDRPLRLEFVRELTNHAHEVRRLEDPANTAGCLWHDHADGGDCVADEDD